MDSRFSVEGGPVHGANWESLNEAGFLYKIGKLGPSAPNPVTFYKDNANRPGFAEPYGMNVATDDRATLYARLMTEDKGFFDKLATDKILTAKTEKMLAFFQFLKKDLAIPTPSPFFTKLENVTANLLSRLSPDPVLP